jgi:hypothetical protein
MNKKHNKSFLPLLADERLRLDLESRKCDWEVLEEVDLSHIDISDNEYQTRLDCATMDRDLVNKYKDRLTAGDKFPEILLAADAAQRGKSRITYQIVGGKNRMAAALALGYSATNAVVMYISNESDKAKARDISIQDNVANGKPVSTDVMYEQIAKECISESGGFSEGYPGRMVVSSVCLRHQVPHADSIKKHIERLLFQHECRKLKLKSPTIIDVCAAAYQFLESEGFDDIAKAVCQAGDAKGLASILRDCKRRRLKGVQVVKAIGDFSAGYKPYKKAAAAMSSVARVRLACDALIKQLEGGIASDASVTLEDCNEIDGYISHVLEIGSSVVSLARKKASGK